MCSEENFASASGFEKVHLECNRSSAPSVRSCFPICLFRAGDGCSEDGEEERLRGTASSHPREGAGFFTVQPCSCRR